MTRLMPLLICAGCAAADPAAGRTALLHDCLVADNAVWLSRGGS